MTLRLPCIALVSIIVAHAYSETHVWRQPVPAERSFRCESESDEAMFWKHNDWGSVSKYQDNVKNYCQEPSDDASALWTNREMTFAEARNIWVKIDKPEAYPDDHTNNPTTGSLKNCRLSTSFPPIAKGLFSLTDWQPELASYSDTSSNPPHCDAYFNETVIFTRGDAQGNFYHNLCDFVNLYLSLYVARLENSTLNDVSILYWEPERKFPWFHVLDDLYKMITLRPLIHVNNHFEKTLCFRHAVFAVKPRTLYTFFFNQPVAPNCIAGSSSFMRRFSDSAVVAVLGNSSLQRTPQARIVVSMLSRSHGLGHTAATRHVLNEDVLLKRAKAQYPMIDMTLEYFDFSDKVSFHDQMARIRRSDILVGMHGAGLAHMMFLPEWGAVYEVHHCYDPGCYYDLSRELGLFHISGDDEDMGAKVPPVRKPISEEPKFWNYKVKPAPFLEKLGKAIDYVMNHPKFPGIVHEEL